MIINNNSKRKMKRRAGYVALGCICMLPLFMAGCAGRSGQQGDLPDLPYAEGQMSEAYDADDQIPESGNGNDQISESGDADAKMSEDQSAGNGNNGTADTKDGSQSAQPSAGAAGNNGGSTTIDMEEVKNTALSHAGLTAAEVTFIKEEMDYDDGRAEYEIEFVTDTMKYEYEVSAENGVVLKSSREAIDKTNGGQQAQGGITLEEAKKIALDQAGMSEDMVTFTKLELEYDDGISQYEIEFFANGTEYSVSIHASTGAVLEMETD